MIQSRTACPRIHSNRFSHFGVTTSAPMVLSRMHLIHTYMYTYTNTRPVARASRVCNGGQRAAFMQIRACARGKFLIQFGFACAYMPGT